MSRFLLSSIASVCVCMAAVADESDQFLSWDAELSDAAPVLNAYIDQSIAGILAEANANPDRDCDCQTLTFDVFAYIYRDRLRETLVQFIEDFEAIDVYPSREVAPGDLLDLSIYRDVTLPYIIRVTRNIRVGNVYFGVDKLAHLFGFGSRYYRFYLWYRALGLSEEEAEENAILWGVLMENTFLGRGITGIFSHADLEANYHGMLLARDFCEGDRPFIKHDGKRWVQMRPVNLTEYITPGFDESFNPSEYANGLRDKVLQLLRDIYSVSAESSRVTQRFREYDSDWMSRSTEVVARYFSDRGESSGRDRVREALDLSDAHPMLWEDAAQTSRVIGVN